MTRKDLLAKLHEHILFVTTIAASTQLMQYYAACGNAADAKLVGNFLCELALDRRDRLDEFDDALQQEKMSLLSDEELLPLCSHTSKRKRG